MKILTEIPLAGLVVVIAQFDRLDDPLADEDPESDYPFFAFEKSESRALACYHDDGTYYRGQGEYWEEDGYPLATESWPANHEIVHQTLWQYLTDFGLIKSQKEDTDESNRSTSTGVSGGEAEGRGEAAARRSQALRSSVCESGGLARR